ncbi:MAG TPA: GIY-YIG nuclease family protein [Acidobacteriaceae bacterium]|nr:GIY-YIG nuclease family protein [Acidobacteriaceae bacterium]
MPDTAYVYILANGFKRLYIGITTDLQLRVTQHKGKKSPDSHTAKYNITQLVYFERFTTITAAIQREKQLKGWLRIRKLELIISTNPTWRDLSAAWGQPIPPFDESQHPRLPLTKYQKSSS